MGVSQKCQYALRALFELAKRSSEGPVSVTAIAEAQAIPARFLELVLNQLKKAGLIRSRRGTQGGYLLAVDPKTLSVAQIVETIDGSLSPVQCVRRHGVGHCALRGNCVFIHVWMRARDAVAAVYEGITLQDLIDEEKAMTTGTSNYNI